MILILHLVCILCILELLLLNYDCISEGNENQLKRLGTERVNLIFWAVHIRCGNIFIFFGPLLPYVFICDFKVTPPPKLDVGKMTTLPPSPNEKLKR